MPVGRSPNSKPVPVNVVGSSTFGRYPKISIEKTYNMYESDGWLVPYPGYQNANLLQTLGTSGRAIYASAKFNRLVVVVDNKVYLVNIFFDQNLRETYDTSVTQIGTLQTYRGPVYIAENNKPQIAISDGTAIYIYDPTNSPVFSKPSIDFVPGYIDFHDTYFVCAASNDQFYSPAANNTWRLSGSNDGLTWSASAQTVGLLQTKPDNVQAVVRFPSRGNMVFVMGQTVTEAWFNVGYQLFPYQRNSSYNIDYGCLNPLTIASTDQVVVWLAQNDKSGPVIMYSTGGLPEKITSDGIDYLFSQMKNPADSQAFIYRQDGHLIYHINFYTDNVSLFYDFNTKKFYHACDENLNYFIANDVAFFNNQYYFVTKNNGNVYAFDTIYTTYDGAEIPRIRTTRSIREPSQDYFIASDVGFTIEQGETAAQKQYGGPIFLITQDGKRLITEGGPIYITTEDGKLIQTQDGNTLVSQQTDPNGYDLLISEQPYYLYIEPRVDLSISTDGGQSFGSDFPYVLNPLGRRKNRLMWWQLGIANDLTLQFKFWGLGRFVVTDGLLNIRER